MYFSKILIYGWTLVSRKIMQKEYDWIFHEHSSFEELLEEIIEQADIQLWRECEDNFELLVGRVKRHMGMEEEVLYPAYEQIPDLPLDPVNVLREDHDNIVRLFSDINKILKMRDSEQLLDVISPLVEALNTHHRNEEDFFLPLAGFLLLPYRDQIMEDLKSFSPATIQRKWPF